MPDPMSLAVDPCRNVLIAGDYGAGKTFFLKNAVAELPDGAVGVYLNLREAGYSPRHIALHILSELDAQLRKMGLQRKFNDGLLDPGLESFNVLKGLFPAICERARTFGVKIIVVLDDLEKFVCLRNYPGVKDPLAVVFAPKENVFVWAATSWMQYVRNSLQKEINDDWEVVHFPRWSAERVRPVIRDIASRRGIRLSEGAVESVINLSAGLPAVFLRLLNAVALKHREDAEEIREASIIEAYFRDLLSSTGGLFTFYQSMFDHAIDSARGFGLLKAVMKTVADSDGLSLTEIAEQIGRKPATTRDCLVQLQLVNLLKKSKRYYYPADPGLGTWLAATQNGSADSFAADPQYDVELIYSDIFLPHLHSIPKTDSGSYFDDGERKPRLKKEVRIKKAESDFDDSFSSYEKIAAAPIQSEEEPAPDIEPELAEKSDSPKTKQRKRRRIRPARRDQSMEID